MFATDRGDDVITTLPEDTAAALGFGFADGWVTHRAGAGRQRRPAAR